MTVTIDDLRQIVDGLLAHLGDLGYGTVDLDKDFYWHLNVSGPTVSCFSVTAPWRFRVEATVVFRAISLP